MLIRWGLHLAVLWSFAVAQPLLDLLGDAPEFFVARENTRGDIILLALAVVVIAPLLLVGAEALASLVSRRLAWTLHLALVGLLTAAFAVQLLDDWFGGGAGLLIGLAILAGGLAALAYARTRAAPTLLTVLSPVPLLFLVVFLVISPTSKLVLPGGEVEAANVAVPSKTPVVVIFFDEFSGLALMGRDHRIDAARYPNFAELARDATWYRNATTVADITEQAIPALLTGEDPTPGETPIAADHPESLFTLLGGKYSFNVAEPVTDVCPRQFCPGEAARRASLRSRLHGLASDLSLVSLHLLAPEDLESHLPAVDRSFGDFRGDAASAAAPAGGQNSTRGFAAFAAIAYRSQLYERFLRSLGRGTSDRRLSLLHTELPHSPYVFLPTGQRYKSPFTGMPGLGSDNVWHDRWLATQALERYLLQAGYADRLLGRTIARLRATGQYDKSLVVIAADHGASFVPGTSHRAVKPSNITPVASIPLFVKAPGQRHGRVVDANVQTTDVLPTIAHELGVRLPWKIDGRVATAASDDGAVTVRNSRAQPVSIPFKQFVRERNAIVDRQLSRLGPVTHGGFYAAGPARDVLGREVGAAPRAPEGRVVVDDAGALAFVRPRAPTVPSFLTGHVRGARAGAPLAVAVNGRVAATTSAYSDDGEVRFSAVVPASAFSRGPNTVAVLAITGPRSARRLVELGRSRAGRG